MRPEHTTPISSRGVTLAALWGLMLWFVTAGLATWSIDFGHHWDEATAMDAVQHSALDRDLLPGFYKYPSLVHEVALIAMLPELMAGQATEGEHWTEEFRHGLLLRMRRVSAWFTLFAIVGVSILTQILTRDRWATLSAPLLLAASFEYFYHARWLAPDGYMATLGTLTLAIFVVASHRHSSRWLLFGAALAGLTCGAKYPGGIMLLPGLLLVWQIGSKSGRIRLAIQVAAIFAAAFFVSTPGSVFDPTLFRDHVWEEVQHYASSHRAYTTPTPIHHLGQMTWYLVAVFPSKHLLLASALAVPMLWGVIVLYRTNRTAFSILALTIIAYLTYFAMQKVMIVRNYLVAMPVLAVMAGIGIADLRRRAGRVAGPTLLAIWCAALAWNAVEQYRDARSVRYLDQLEAVREFREFARNNPDLRFAATSQVHDELGDEGPELGVVTAAPFDFVLAFQRERGVRTTTNLDGYIVFSTGPREVNLDYYSSWKSGHRLVVLDPAKGAIRWPAGWLLVGE